MVRKGRDLSSILESLDEAPAAPALPPEAAEPSKLVPLSILVTRADRKRLKELSVAADLSLQKMGLEAWSLWLERRGLPPLEPVTANVPSGRRR